MTTNNALEKGIDLYGGGSATYRLEARARGLEPDESYCLDHRKKFPDLAIEVILTSGGIDKLKIYQGLGIGEVWFWQNGKFTLYELINSEEGYRGVIQSQLLSGLDLEQLAHFVKPNQEPEMVRNYQKQLRF